MIICSPQLGLSPNSTLGGEVFDREILLGLAKKGIKVEIILPKNKPHDKDIKNWDITFLPISHFPAMAANLLYLPYIFSAYKKHKFQILRLHQPQFMIIGAMIFKLFHSEVKLIATYHQLKESNFGPLSIFFNNYFDNIICDSEVVKNKIATMYSVPVGKISVVHNGVPSYLKPGKKDKKLLRKMKLERKFTLLFMGRFIQRKNPLFLIEVVKKLSRQSKDICLIFWGEGPQKEEMKSKIKQNNLESFIKFQNPLYGKEKNKIHNLADIFVHPSLDEGFALAPLEAMMCAKPVLMNDSHSAKEAIVDAENGFICKTNDVDDWIKKIGKLKDNNNILKRMSKKAHEKALKNFTWKASIATHQKVLRKLISN